MIDVAAARRLGFDVLSFSPSSTGRPQSIPAPSAA
jgi:hypothetical protein